MEGMMERTRRQGGVYGGVLSLCLGWKIKQQQKYKNNTYHGLRWPPFDILHTTTNQKHAGVTGGGWDRTRDWVGMIGKWDSIVLGLLSTSKHDPSKYPKVGNIANNNDKYAIGDNGINEPLTKGDNEISTPRAKTMMGMVCQGL
jgi:hypothetical protein